MRMKKIKTAVLIYKVLVGRILVATVALAAAGARADFPDGCSPTLDLGLKFPGATGTVQTVNGELRIGYDFSGGGHYVAARFDRIPVPPVVRELSFLSDFHLDEVRISKGVLPTDSFLRADKLQKGLVLLFR